MCLYQHDPRWQREAQADRAKDVVSGLPGDRVGAREPIMARVRPVVQRALGAACAAWGRMRRATARAAGLSSHAQ